MARDFTINIDNSWVTGSIGGTTVYKPFVQFVNSVPSIKNMSRPYELILGDKHINPSTNNSTEDHTIS